MSACLLSEPLLSSLGKIAIPQLTTTKCKNIWLISKYCHLATILSMQFVLTQFISHYFAAALPVCPPANLIILDININEHYTLAPWHTTYIMIWISRLCEFSKGRCEYENKCEGEVEGSRVTDTAQW